MSSKTISKNTSKTMITLSVEKNIKEDFAQYAQSMGTNMSQLIKMFMVSAPKTPKIEFYNFFPEQEPSKDEKNIINNYLQNKQKNMVQSVEVDTDFFNAYK